MSHPNLPRLDEISGLLAQLHEEARSNGESEHLESRRRMCKRVLGAEIAEKEDADLVTVVSDTSGSLDASSQMRNAPPVPCIPTTTDYSSLEVDELGMDGLEKWLENNSGVLENAAPCSFKAVLSVCKCLERGAHNLSDSRGVVDTACSLLVVPGIANLKNSDEVSTCAESLRKLILATEPACQERLIEALLLPMVLGERSGPFSILACALLMPTAMAVLPQTSVLRTRLCAALFDKAKTLECEADVLLASFEAAADSAMLFDDADCLSALVSCMAAHSTSLSNDARFVKCLWNISR